MDLRDEDYNAFARGLVHHFAERARGLDRDSARIVGCRPPDQVLAGFITPAGSPPPEENEDAAAARDLPSDSPYEQSAIGMEWLAPAEAFAATHDLSLSVQFFVYVRRLPEFRELGPPVWRTIRQPGERRDVVEADIPHVWTRECVAPITVALDIEALRDGPITRELAGDVTAAWQAGDRAFVFPGRRRLTLSPGDETEDGYAAWRRRHTIQDAALPIRWRPQLDVRATPYPSQPGLRRVSVRIINRTERVNSQIESFVDPNLYGVQMTIRVPLALHRPTVFRELPSSFRYDRNMAATGINAQVMRSDTPDAIVLETRTICQHEAPRLVPRTLSVSPAFAALADSTDPLRALAEDMGRFQTDAWQAKLGELSGVERDEAAGAAADFEREVARFRRGIDLLEDERYPQVRHAFVLMNQTMARAVPYQQWHLFQIVFIVSQLPELAAREYEELARPDDGQVEILWFAAGGGKTEAFLGLIVWHAFFDRLRGKRFGTTALVRFPLRLLSFQQLIRFSRILAVAEILRTEEQIPGARFSLGFFVGRPVTPNKIENEVHRRFVAHGVDEGLQRIFDCPFCGSPVRIEYESHLRLIQHLCSNPQCAGGRSRLPIYIVDEDIYRFLPTVIVSTVDKLAQIGQNQRAANLFGRISALCRCHGATFHSVNRALCSAAVALASGQHPETCNGEAVEYAPFHDLAPALLVQDEMHLLSEELGAFDAHYETAAMSLASSLGARPWKIIGASATIEDYEEHAWQLYLRHSRRFPAPGPTAVSSFYFHPSDGGRIGRIFVGLLGVGRKHTPIVSRALTLLYLEIQKMRELSAQNPAIACSRYALRPLSQHELRRLVFLYELVLSYVLTRKGSDQISETIESRVKKELALDAPAHGQLRVETFNSGVDVSEMINAMKQIEGDSDDGDPTARIRGLVTTNIIGHGVDVDRFNVILFAGYTRLAAEYIQASARVGRTFPGVSILAVTPQSERDRSIFDRFGKFHEYLDRLVDPSALTRWSEPALTRTLPGILAAYFLGVASAEVGVPLWSVETIQEFHGQHAADSLRLDEILAWVLQAYGADEAPSAQYREHLQRKASNLVALVTNARLISGRWGTAVNIHLGSMRSLRDVDDPAQIRVGQPDHLAALRRLIRG